MFKLDISDKRLEKFESVASRRQLDLTVLLENVHDLHNIGAVLRSCDSIGIDEIYVLDTDPRLVGRKLNDNQSSSTGINKWIRIHQYTDMDKCMSDIKAKYEQVIGTVIKEDSKDLYAYDYTGSTVIVFGNEKEGITSELQKHLDHNMVIPQVGFAQSLNISVACAVTLYEVYRQRSSKNQYIGQDNADISSRYRMINETKKLHKKDKRIKLR